MASYTFNYTGGAQGYAVPTGVTAVTIDMAGGQGGLDYAQADSPALGGRVQFTYTVSAGQTYQIWVGGAGANAPSGTNGGNGGGNGGAYGFGGKGGAAPGDSGVSAGGGGGAATVFADAGSVAIGIAPGGGGGAEGSVAGGGGGGTSGSAGSATAGATAAGGGTSGGGGAGGIGDFGTGGAGTSTAGGLGSGGGSPSSGCSQGGGGGGGGLYGGGGGGGAKVFGLNEYGGGGGGSALVPGGGSTTGAYQTGNGYLTLTEVIPPPPPAPTLVSPASGTFLDAYGLGVTFTAIYNSSTGNNMSDYALSLTPQGGTATYWNGSSFGGSIVWNADSVAPGGTISVSVPASVITDGTIYNWSFATEDAVSSLQGPFANGFTLNTQVAPVVTVTAPTGTESTTTLPTVTWTVAGGTQITYRVVVEHGSYSTTPGSGTQDWDSGVITSPALLAMVQNPLFSGTTYRAFVQVMIIGTYTSPWAYSDFTISVSVPATPTITAVVAADITTGCPYIAITVTGADSGGFIGHTLVVIQRSDGAYVRYASQANPYPVTAPEPAAWNGIIPYGTSFNASAQMAMLSDYEAVPYQSYTYTAYIYDATGPVTSDPVTSTPAVELQTSQWWELDPTNPAGAVNAQVTSWNPQVTEQSTAHLVMGQTNPNVIGSSMGGLDGAATFETFTAPIFAAFQALLLSQKTIFISSSFGSVDTLYARFGPMTGGLSTGSGNKVKDAQLQASTAAAPYRITSITWVSQPRPSV